MEFIKSPRSSSRQGSSTSAASGRISMRGPTHSTPVKAPSTYSQSLGSYSSTPGSTTSKNIINTSTGSHIDSYREDSFYSDLELSYEGINSSSSTPHNRSATSNTNKTGATSMLSQVKKNLSLTLGEQKQASFNSNSLNSSSRKPKRVIRSPFAGVSAATEAEDRANEAANAEQAKMADYENQTIQKQRAELTLLVTELRDRDQELNDMVMAHQKQLTAWEQDRRKISDLQDKCAKLEREIQNKNDDVRSLMAKLRVVECEDKDKTTALNSTQEQLVLMSEQQSHTSVQIHDLEQRNRSLSETVHQMSCSVGQLEAREQELLTVLQLKDRDLSEASTRLAEVGAKLKKTELQYSEAKDSESENRRKVTDWKNKFTDQQREIDYTQKLLKRSEQRCDEQHVEIQRLRQEISTLKKELLLAGEREKRKKYRLDLQRSKQERSDSELANVRQLYERQQRDLSLLHVNLENTKDLLYKNNISVPGMGSIGLPKTSPSSRRNYSYSSRLHGNDSSYRNYSHEPETSIYRDSSMSRYNTDSSGQFKSNSAGYRRTAGSTSLRTPDRENKFNLSVHSCDDNYYEKTDSYSPKILNNSVDNQDIGEVSSAHSNDGFQDDNGLEVQLSETPTPPAEPSPDKKKAANKALIATKESSVKETDSAATKLHKLLTESRDMVEELERSVGEQKEGNSGENHKEIPTADTEQESVDNSPTPLDNDTSQHSNDILTNGEAEK